MTRIRPKISFKIIILLTFVGTIFILNLIRSSDEFDISSLPPDHLYLSFVSEIYDTISENYWKEMSNEDLSNLFKLATEKVTETDQLLQTNNKDGVELMITEIIKDKSDEEKKEIITRISDIALANLQPFGRSRLYGQKQREELKNTVQNIDPETNLYNELGINKDANKDEIDKAYQNKISEINQDTQEGQEKLAQISRAYDVISDTQDKEKYDELGVEPTVISKLIRPRIYYIKIKKFSPLTLDEFVQESDKSGDENLPDTLILDLRGNIGGAIDILQYFLGPFIGNNQYAYEFFHQGESEPFKTKTGWLPSLIKFKKVVILIDSDSQSTAEVMAATLKKYNVGIVIGTPTKGWGTIEQIIPMKNEIDSSEKYSVFLVHSLTISDDGQPIEGKGVYPTIDINDPDWDDKLFQYFHYQELIDVVGELFGK